MVSTLEETKLAGHTKADTGYCDFFRQLASTSPGGSPMKTLCNVLHGRSHGQLCDHTRPHQIDMQREEARNAIHLLYAIIHLCTYIIPVFRK